MPPKMKYSMSEASFDILRKGHAEVGLSETPVIPFAHIERSPGFDEHVAEHLFNAADETPNVSQTFGNHNGAVKTIQLQTNFAAPAATAA